MSRVPQCAVLECAGLPFQAWRPPDMMEDLLLAGIPARLAANLTMCTRYLLCRDCLAKTTQRRYEFAELIGGGLILVDHEPGDEPHA